jgi:hypothetical protein
MVVHLVQTTTPTPSVASYTDKYDGEPLTRMTESRILQDLRDLESRDVAEQQRTHPREQAKACLRTFLTQCTDGLRRK